MRSPRLSSINSVKCLIKKQSNSPRRIYPSWHVLVKRGIIPEKGQEIEDDEAETRESDGIRCHGHGEAFDGDIVVERLEDIFRD